MGRALWREAKDWTGAARAVRLGDEDADRDADPRVVCHCSTRRRAGARKHPPDVEPDRRLYD